MGPTRFLPRTHVDPAPAAALRDGGDVSDVPLPPGACAPPSRVALLDAGDAALCARHVKTHPKCQPLTVAPAPKTATCALGSGRSTLGRRPLAAWPPARPDTQRRNWSFPFWSTRRYDGRLLHCGGANRSDELRVLFYLTFRAADGGQVGGEDGGRRATAADGLTLESLMAGCVSAS